MKPSIESKVVVFPLKGRLWLPSDCETVEALIGKLWTYHNDEAKAEHRGIQHGLKHLDLRDKAREALKFFVTLNP